MNNTLIVSTLSLGVFLLLVSIPGFEVATALIKARRPCFKFPMWDRMILVTVSGILLSLGVHGVVTELFDATKSIAWQLTFVPAGAVTLYNLALWIKDTFMPWKGRPFSERAAKIVLMLPVVLLPLLIPILILLG